MKQLLATANATEIFKNEAKRNQLSHAYLLVFPDEKFLRSVLKEFAKILFNANERDCDLIDKEYLTDCKIFPESGKKLSVADASAIVEDCKILPVEGDKKVYLLDGFHNASASVQNKLLKVLEEPPKGVYFLLGTTSEFPVLPTVLSRVRKLVFSPFSEEQVYSFLKRNYPDNDNLFDYASSSGGILSEAIALMEGKYYAELLSVCKDICSMKESDLPALCLKASSFKQKGEFLSLLRLVFRDILMYNSNGKPLLKGVSLQSIAKDYNAAACVAILESITVAERDLKFNAAFPALVENILFTVIKEKEKCLK